MIFKSKNASLKFDKYDHIKRENKRDIECTAEFEMRVYSISTNTTKIKDKNDLAYDINIKSDSC